MGGKISDVAVIILNPGSEAIIDETQRNETVKPSNIIDLDFCFVLSIANFTKLKPNLNSRESIFVVLRRTL